MDYLGGIRPDGPAPLQVAFWAAPASEPEAGLIPSGTYFFMEGSIAGKVEDHQSWCCQQLLFLVFP